MPEITLVRGHVPRAIGSGEELHGGCGFIVATEGKLKVANAIFGWLQRERQEEVAGRDIHHGSAQEISNQGHFGTRSDRVG